MNETQGPERVKQANVHCTLGLAEDVQESLWVDGWGVSIGPQMDRGEQRHILLNRILPLFPPNPTLLRPPKRNIRMYLIRTINPRRPRLKSMHEPQFPRNILHEHRCCEPRQWMVRLSKHVGVVLELDHDTDGPEDLFVDDSHVGRRARENGGLDPVPFFAVTEAAELECCTFGFAGLDVGHDALNPVAE